MISKISSPLFCQDTNRASPDFNALIKAVEKVEGHSTSYFKDSKEAKVSCLEDLRAIGVAQEGEQFVVVSTKLGPPYKMPSRNGAKDLTWLYLKAYYEPATVNVLCNMKKSIKTIHKQGRVRESYKLQNGMQIKLFHHSCTALQSVKPCRNCKHKKAHARCLSGSQFYCLSKM